MWAQKNVCMGKGTMADSKRKRDGDGDDDDDSDKDEGGEG